MLSEETIIDHCDRIRRVTLHINQNLDKKFRLEHLSDVACFSQFHFIRIFETLMGETPQQYVIRKRMEQAGYALLEKKRRVTDIALGVAYNTHSAFCKVFKIHFGMSPRQFRDSIPNWQYTKVNHPFRAVIGNRNRSSSMPIPVIRTLPAIKMICIQNQGVINGSFLATNLTSYKAFRKKVARHGLNEIVSNLVSIYPNRPLGIHDDQVTNFVGAMITRGTQLTENFHYFVYPPGKYALFKHFGSYDFIPQTWNRAYMNWYPKSGRSIRDLPPLEIHLDDPDPSNKLALQSYLLIPIL